MTSDLHIRDLHEDDCLQLADFHQRAVRTAYPAFYPQHVVDDWAASRTPEGYLRSQAKGETFLVAALGGKPVGFIGWKDGELCGMYVDPDYHGQKIGQRLVASATLQAQTNGAPITFVRAALAAIGFYEKMGFRIVEETTDTVQGHTIACMKMVRE